MEVDFSKDFFGKETNLTVSGQLEAEPIAWLSKSIYLWSNIPGRKLQLTPSRGRILDDQTGNSLCRPAEDMDLAEDMLKYIIGCLEALS